MRNHRFGIRSELPARVAAVPNGLEEGSRRTLSRGARWLLKSGNPTFLGSAQRLFRWKIREKSVMPHRNPKYVGRPHRHAQRQPTGQVPISFPCWHRFSQLMKCTQLKCGACHLTCFESKCHRKSILPFFETPTGQFFHPPNCVGSIARRTFGTLSLLTIYGKFPTPSAISLGVFACRRSVANHLFPERWLRSDDRWHFIVASLVLGQSRCAPSAAESVAKWGGA